MSDLIERQVAENAICNACGKIDCDQMDTCEMLKLPSAQPEIVRCRDCKYWREGTVYLYCDKLFGMGVLDAYDYMTDEDDFCSMAERRTDEPDK